MSQLSLIKQLARVESVSLEIEDHGILTCWLRLVRENAFYQEFGGYSLDEYDENLKRRVGTAAGLDWILQILQVFGVSKLEDIKGKMCYGLYDEDAQRYKGIQSLNMNGGKSFIISDWQQQWYPKECPAK